MSTSVERAPASSRGPAASPGGRGYERGASALEMVLAVALTSTLAAASVVTLSSGTERLRAGSAARHLLAVFRSARVDAARRGSSVAVRFVTGRDGVSMTSHVDGDGDGITSDDLEDGTDPPLDAPRRLEDDFPGVAVAIRSDVIEIDGNAVLEAGSDALRLGGRDAITFTPEGTSSGGTVYLSGTDGTVYAVRTLSSTGRARALVFDRVRRTWEAP